MPLSLMSAPAVAQGPTPPPTTNTPPPSAPATPAGKALAQAKKDNRRVEIESLRSETTTYYANPDGKTLRMELNLEPVRVKNGDGFTPIDTTLVETGGVIRPKAVKGDLTLSAGGDTTAIKSKSAKAIVRVDAVGKLPKPTLKGNTATYASAYGKGIDLMVTATPTGFRQQIVIKERPAQPVTFRIPVDLPKGLSFDEDDRGRPTLKSEDGKTFLDIRPAPLLDAIAADPSGDLDAAKVGRAAVTLDGSDLVYTPDQAFLADPATAYPVTMAAVDDDWYECGLDRPSSTYCPDGVSAPYDGEPMDTFVNDADYPDSWSNFNLDRILVGKSNSGGVRWRSYIQFPLPAKSDPFWGSTIENADLTLWNHLSSDCGLYVGSGVTARRVTSDWDELEMTWSNQPSVTSTGANTEYGGYNSTNCSGSFDYEWDLIHSVNGIVQAWANGEPNYGVQLTAGSESDVTNWRRYRTRESTYPSPAHAPRLSVDFEPPVPPRQETVVTTSREPLTSIPEYEEALTKSVYTPELDEPIEQLSGELIAANEDQRDSAGTLIGTDKLSPALPDPGDSDNTTNPGGEDTTPPRVRATEPTSGATDVSLDAHVRVTFSEEIFDPEFVVRSPQGTQIQGTTMLDDTKKIATFTPAQPLHPGATYTVEVSGAIDVWENEMAPYTWSFRTIDQAAARWAFDEGDGRTAADSSGNHHDASLNDTAEWTVGKSGNAISNVPSQARVAASRAAAQQGEAAEVTDETTATSITYAQPDGQTFKTEVTAGPVRARQGGGWAPIDTTLAQQDGKLRAKTLAEGAVVEISAGGTDPFVKMSADGKSYALRWPTPLPKPAVKGSAATYTDAAGVGADLVVTALPTGFRHEVVLRQRPSKPLELRIGVEDEGLTLTEGKGGWLLLKGKDKKLVAAGTRPVVSDGSAKGRPAKRGSAGGDVVTKDGRTELVIEPDQKFLADTGTTYPVSVAAVVTLPTLADAWISDYGVVGSSTYRNRTLWVGTYDEGEPLPQVERAYMKFDTAALNSVNVSAATLSVRTTDANGCGDAQSGLKAQRITAAWTDTALTWDAKPGTTTAGEAVATDHPGCAVPGTMSWNLAAMTQAWASGTANHGIMLRGVDETFDGGRPQYNRAFESFNGTNKPTLNVTYTLGSTPTVAGLQLSPATSTGGTVTATSLTPQLTATVADTAGGNLTGQFEVEHDPAATGQGSGQIWTGTSSVVASGSQAMASVPAGKLVDGWKIRWRARAANTATSSTSAWSDWQTAIVDVLNPTVGAFQVTPSQVVDGRIVATSLTPALRANVTDPAAHPLRAEFELEHDPTATGQGNGQIWSGVVDNVTSGTQASATVPDGKLSDGWKVRWRVRAINMATTVGSPWSDWQVLNVDVPDPVSEPAVGALQITPSQQVDGTTVTPTLTPTLLAQVIDPAGKPLRAEAEIEHDPAAPTGQGSGQIWTGSADNVPAGTQASLAVPANTLTDRWMLRWRGRAVSATATSAWSDWQFFTVSLPKPTATGLTITPSKVVDGVTVTDTLTPALQATLTYPTGQALRAEAEIEHDPAATGQGSGQIWTGAVDNVASGSQASVAVPGGKLADGWKVRWRLRAVAGDVSSAWSDWQQVTVDIVQSGEEPLAATAGPVIRTDQSFTAAAWLRWSDKDGDYTVLEQKGAHQAPFKLGNTAEHGLVFAFTGADATNATVEGVLSGVEPPVDAWFHLAGVYDAATRTATLYLNGVQAGTAQLSFPSWNVQAPLWIGAAMAGSLDEVQIYQRPFSADEIASVMAPGLVPVVAPALQRTAATQATAATGGFDYERINLQTCQVSGSETGHGEYDARIRELPYNSCWSSYLQVNDYIEDESSGRLIKAGCKSAFKKNPILNWACKQMAEPFDEDLALRFRATVVIHSYLGNATGTGVVSGAGTGIKPTDMKMFIQLDDFALIGEDGQVIKPGNQLNDLPITTRLYIPDPPLTDEGCTTGDGEKKKDISTWQSSPFDIFNIRTNIDDPGVVTCAFHPEVVFYTESGSEWLRLPLFSQKVIDVRGEWVGVAREGNGVPAGWKRWMPHFRCDSLAFGAGDPQVEDRVGGCINTRSKRVFVMSTKSGTEFPEVALHIKDALNPATNKSTYPPKRPGEFVVPNPPKKAILGTEQPKRIPGNWAAPVGSDAGEPLHRTTSDEKNAENRLVFSRRAFVADRGNEKDYQWPDDPSSNYCKYYQWEEKYTAPGARWKDLNCDEYPFAATLEGAASTEWDFSIRALNAKQNRDQGNALKRFYAEFRVGNENSFWVMIE